jgi:hypothetical protein
MQVELAENFTKCHHIYHLYTCTTFAVHNLITQKLTTLRFITMATKT